MQKQASTILLFVCLSWTLLIPACLLENSPPESTLQLCAATSLRHDLPSILNEWTRESGQPIAFRFDASSRLARQIKAGLSCSIFVSASEEWATDLIESGFALTEPRVHGPGNGLAVLTRSGLNSPVKTLADLSALNRVALAAPSIPLGGYTRDALSTEGVSLKAPVFGRNAGHVFRLVEDGIVDAAVVYTSEIPYAKSAQLALQVPPHTHRPIGYEWTVTHRAEPAALALMKWIQSRVHGLPLTAVNTVRGEGRVH